MSKQNLTKFLILVLAPLILSACNETATPPAASTSPVPTLAIVPVTETSQPPPATVTPQATATPVPTATATAEETATPVQESVSTSTPLPNPTPSPTLKTEAPELPFAINLPPGFEIKVYAANVLNARSMALGPGGTLFVGTRQLGNLYAVLDQNQDYVADEVITLAGGMFMPNGVAVRDGDLYVAEVNRVLRFDEIEANLPQLPQAVIVNDQFPRDTWHGWKYIRFGPDGMLYVPVGAPCNVCETEGTPFGTITRMYPDGSDLEIFAQGVRNSVGFDFHPVTEELWFTDNGRDNLGDDLPPDELNHAPEQGLHFGFPYCHSGTISDPEISHTRRCDEFVPPAQPLGPHVASLGMRFYTGDMFPEEYHNQIFIAEHGSWNRSVPIGYRITLVRLEDNNVVSYEPFAEGWLRNGEAWGRPVDLLIMPDGSMLVSDDTAGAIYRISYR